MGRPVQPYLYYNQKDQYSDPFSSGFDPKAVTRASWTPAPPKPKHEGPLINFNRHPDSWQQAPYGATTAIPLKSTTKRNIQIVRWIQLVLRSLNWVGATGVLVCMALLSNVQGITSWVTRAAPAVDFVVALYGIAHFARGAKKKVPASAASYHTFATLIDIAIIPFYVFIALTDRWNVSQPVDNKNRWRSLLKSPDAANSLIAYTWIIALVVGGLHVVTASLSVYLAIIFRKIAKLPPDLNPLEDNLTSRRKSKHKYKSSDMSDVSELRSKHDSGISLPWEDEKRPLSFLSTRNESTGQLYSPHNPKTANESRASLPISAPGVADSQERPPSSASSSIHCQPTRQRVPNTHISHSAKPPPRAGSPLKQTELSRLNSVAASSVYSDQSDGSKKSAPILPRKSSKRASGTFSDAENWCTFQEDKENDGQGESVFSIVPEEDEESSTENVVQLTRPYQPIRNSSFVENLDDEPMYEDRYAPNPPPKSPAPPLHKKIWDPTVVLQPLSMNPPTPPPLAAGYSSPGFERRGFEFAPPSPSSPGTSANGSRPSSLGKSRYYGDLKSAVNGVRNSPQASPAPRRPLPSPHQEPGVNTNEWLTPPRSRQTIKIIERDEQPQYEQLNERIDGKGRVLSRTGVDLSDGMESVYGQEPNEFKDFMGMNARNVSGKVVEEGLGGGWARRRISGR
ncbi:MAG: hypothetical protein Q9162_002270 [Coniocarpon cinnabarinum]